MFLVCLCATSVLYKSILHHSKPLTNMLFLWFIVSLKKFFDMAAGQSLFYFLRYNSVLSGAIGMNHTDPGVGALEKAEPSSPAILCIILLSFLSCIYKMYFLQVLSFAYNPHLISIRQSLCCISVSASLLQ